MRGSPFRDVPAFGRGVHAAGNNAAHGGGQAAVIVVNQDAVDADGGGRLPLGIVAG
ncbi:hypothetical protein [Arthrobacter sp. 24S4-2]|uniref:hypothetical protein n=1 Tax=Arthrobacter sp. 24S4-2 TaxID=2575374 RepID=UPI001586A371|nr:hypothetical protein [Arthrobacter sp. 24S4-2]